MLENLSDQLAKTSSLSEKISLLHTLSSVQDFFLKYPFLRSFFTEGPLERQSAFTQLIAIGQAERIFANVDPHQVNVSSLSLLAEKLVAIDHFYREIGGITGYQAKILRLLQGEKEEISTAAYHSPSFIDIAEENGAVKEAIDWGVEGLAEIAEIYPLGGAADRLHLVEEGTGLELPAAKLPFAGSTLLERLIRDLQAREFLYFQKYGVQLTTPIAIMTSWEKNNHAHVLQICESADYFGRPKESIRLFVQPLVPAVNERGDWCLLGPLKPLLKPGGHGAIWKLARDEGIFSWLEKLGRKKALIRQINNPIAGLDYGLLAFTGIGWKKEMTFGFASCPRLLQAAEGVNVLVERDRHIVLTNIEYCDFKKFGIEDLPLKEGEPFSRFSSNTNILFADLKAICKAVEECPFPGLLINLKPSSYTTESGERREEAVARLESTMQNIADVFVEEKREELKTARTYVTYNVRHKTISTAKKAFIAGKSAQETPENCFYDLLRAHRELLRQCQFELPLEREFQEYLKEGPDCLFLYHPALGPLYSLIREKIKKGRLGLGSELILEIADLQMDGLQLQGSLQVIAERPMGSPDKTKGLRYTKEPARCVLENVIVENRGVDWAHSKSKPFWKMDLQRHESTKIILKGKSTFIAKNTSFKGNQLFIVEDGQTLEI